jgi:hypothetical protein
MYLAIAANVSRPLPNRLKGLNPPGINPRIQFFGPLAILSTDGKHTYVALPHDRRTHQLFTRHEVVTMVAPETSAPLAAFTRDRSIRPPSLASVTCGPQ